MGAIHCGFLCQYFFPLIVLMGEIYILSLKPTEFDAIEMEEAEDDNEIIRLVPHKSLNMKAQRWSKLK